jgi:hypothetical protein
MDTSKADFHMQLALLQTVEVINVPFCVSTSKLMKPFCLLYIFTLYCWGAIFPHNESFNLLRIVLISRVFRVIQVVDLQSHFAF